jgi:NDP-sugar pyrophosphorylase family protein
MAGDMLIDVDLPALAARHRARGRDVTLVLRRDPREASFGSVGVDETGRVGRIGRHPVGDASSKSASPAPETARGLFTSIRFFERGVIGAWPDHEVFEDLRDWLMPRAARGEISLGAEVLDAREGVWEPVGTPAEYLDVNLTPPSLPSLGGDASAWTGDVEVVGAGRDVVAARSVRIPSDARLARCVVWDDAILPAGVRARDGVFGARGFHPATAEADQRGAA